MPSSTTDSTSVRVDGQRIVIEHLVLQDPSLATLVAETPEEDRAALAERALRIGLLAICNASTSVNVDVVKVEFERLVADMASKQADAAKALEETLRANFADGDGRLPRQLEAYLGDSGKLNHLVRDLFDEDSRDSALGRLHDLLGRYFEGDGSKLANLLDPTRNGSPLYQFRSEMTHEFRHLNERLEALEEAKKARAEERAKGTAKGIDFEDAIEDRLVALAHGMCDSVERTGTEGGDAGGKKGDFVITLDPADTRGVSLRIVVEAKNRSMTVPRMIAELAGAKANRTAAVGLAIFSPDHAPKSVPPLTMVGGDILTVYDPATDDGVALEAAYRAARILALLTLRDAAVTIDPEAVRHSLEGLAHQVDVVRSLKTKLTGIGSTAADVSRALDLLRDGVLLGVKELEKQLAVVDEVHGGALTA